jgi:signal transduction histidine kinase
VSGIVSLLLTKTLRSSTFKLALICIAIFGTVVFALFGYVYGSTASYVHSRSDHAIEIERTQLRQAYADGGRNGLVAAIEQRIADKRFEGAFYLLADPNLAFLAGNLSVWPAALGQASGWKSLSGREWMPDAADKPALRAMTETLPDGSHLLVGTTIGDLDEFTRNIRTALVWSGLLLLVIAGVASLSVTGRTVGRIESINATSRAIMQSGLGKRIPLRGTRDEWDQVAENLNLMLDRIEVLMSEVKQATDNVAHDLRTPLARMRGRLEKAHARARDSEVDQALIADTIADLDAVLRIFASLTRISQIEASDRKLPFRAVNLTDIAGKVVELFDAAIEERGGELGLTGDAQVVIIGDPDLLFDAIANLVDNAIKHGRAGGRVGVEIARNPDTATVTIADEGRGIPPGEHQHVFKRFYRLEHSRHTPGNGLGLSLVAAVARLHRAEIALIDNAPGLKFRLSFPLAPEQQAVDAKPREAAAPTSPSATPVPRGAWPRESARAPRP